MMADHKCVFCKLDEERMIRETKNTFTILSNPYLMEGHCLVIPKVHYESILEVPKEIRYELIDEVAEVQRLLMERLNAPGVDARQNYRPFISQSRIKVNHLHFHVIPRWSEDVLYQKSMIHEKEVFADLSSDLYKILTEKLS